MMSTEMTGKGEELKKRESTQGSSGGVTPCEGGDSTGKIPTIPSGGGGANVVPEKSKNLGRNIA